ncbi:hypothetical protein [Tropicimonas sp.]|uniref:hypothetical protein n=1 Tax=Tropicimonas sp. TaxID=2067044 RepID=UPI003A897FD9
MPWKILASLLIAVLGAAALTVALAVELVPDAPKGNAWPLAVAGASLVMLAWRSYSQRKR